jgi:hypothetical protein
MLFESRDYSYYQNTFMHISCGIDIHPFLYQFLSHYVYSPIRHLLPVELAVLEGFPRALRLQDAGRDHVRPPGYTRASISCKVNMRRTTEEIGIQRKSVAN